MTGMANMAPKTPVTHNRRLIGDCCSGPRKIVNSLFEVAKSCQQLLSIFIVSLLIF